MYKLTLLFILVTVSNVFSQNTYPPSGVVNFDTNLKIGKQEAVANTAGEIVRLSLLPYAHTGGPWNFKARDVPGIAYLDIDYGLTGAGTLITFGSNKNVGIGTKTPTAALEINSLPITGAETLLKLNVDDSSQDYIKIVNNTTANGQFIPSLQGYHVSDNRAALFLTGMIESANDSGIDPIMTFDSRLNGTPVIARPLFSWDSYGIRKMILTSNGSLGIGTTTTGTHKLAVEGSIGAREIKVQATGWSDFVFKKEYNLPTLAEVETHIKEKGHLENIPNEEEVLKDGINLGEMNAKLLQKIEELTLYVIEQNKQITNLQNRLDKVESNSK